MDFKNILSHLTQLSEATKETGKGRIHTAEPGGYGRKDDEDDEGKKVKADAPKRGRGRPKKDADSDGETKKYDWSAFGGDKKVKLKPWDKSKTTKHSLKEWVQEIENKYVAEAGAPGQALQVKPMPGASQLVDPATQKVIATGPADKIKAMQGSIAKGEVTMTGKQEMAEEGDYSAKKARAGKDIGKPGKQFAKIAKSAGEKYGSKERGEKVAGAVLAKLRKKTNEADIPSDQADFGAGLGAGRSQATFEAKAKPDYIDLDKDGNKKESMKKAAKDAKGKKQVAESMDNRLKSAHHRGKAHALAKESYNCKYDDMEEARMYHEGYKEGLDECYGQVPIRGTVVGEMDIPSTVPGMADQAMEAEMDEGNAFTAALARTPAGGKFSVGGKTFTDRSGYDAKVDETMFESWNNELSSLLEEYDTIQEGMTVSISKGQQGMPDSVSVTAQDQEAEQLLNVIKQAGLGLFGGDEPAQTSSSMSLQPADAGAESDIDVVDDHDGMMALIKKVTGGAGEPNTVAIGGDDHEHSDYEDEEVCDACGSADCDCDEEGHDHDDEKEKMDEVESEDQMAYEVAEDNPPDSGAEETEQEVEDTAQANQSAAETEEVDEEEEEDSEKLDEWANEAGQKGTDAQFETDIAFMTKVIAGGLNKEKATGQTTVPVIASQLNRQVTNESVSDWKKLAGLK